MNDERTIELTVSQEDGKLPYINSEYEKALGAQNYKLRRTKFKPIYGNFWRWITDRPKYWNVEYQFTYREEKND